MRHKKIIISNFRIFKSDFLKSLFIETKNKKSNEHFFLKILITIFLKKAKTLYQTRFSKLF